MQRLVRNLVNLRCTGHGGHSGMYLGGTDKREDIGEPVAATGGLSQIILIARVSLVALHADIRLAETQPDALSVELGIGLDGIRNRTVPALGSARSHNLKSILPPFLKSIVAALDNVASSQNGFPCNQFARGIHAIRIFHKIPVERRRNAASIGAAERRQLQSRL